MSESKRKLPNHGSIIRVLGCDYFVDYNSLESDEKDDRVFFVRALFLYEGKYWFIPSSYSALVTINRDKLWTIVKDNMEYGIESLSIQICEDVCPGFLAG